MYRVECTCNIGVRLGRHYVGLLGEEHKMTETFINLTSYVAQVSVCMLRVGVYISSDLV